MSACTHPESARKSYHDNSVMCERCNSVIEQNGKALKKPCYLGMLPKELRNIPDELRSYPGQTIKDQQQQIEQLERELKEANAQVEAGYLAFAMKDDFMKDEIIRADKAEQELEDIDAAREHFVALSQKYKRERDELARLLKEAQDE